MLTEAAESYCHVIAQFKLLPPTSHFPACIPVYLLDQLDAVVEEQSSPQIDREAIDELGPNIFDEFYIKWNLKFSRYLNITGRYEEAAPRLSSILSRRLSVPTYTNPMLRQTMDIIDCLQKCYESRQGARSNFENFMKVLKQLRQELGRARFSESQSEGPLVFFVFELASLYSSASDFACAKRLFLAVTPLMGLLKDDNYGIQKTWAFLEFALHHLRRKGQDESRKALVFIDLAQASLKNGRLCSLRTDYGGPHDAKIAAENCLVVFLLEYEPSSESSDFIILEYTDRLKSIIRILQMERPINLSEFDPLTKKTLAVLNFEFGWRRSRKSSKYGMTYSVSEITGISNSAFMIT